MSVVKSKFISAKNSVTESELKVNKPDIFGLLPFPAEAGATIGSNVQGYICNMQLPALGKFYGVKLVYRNYDTAAPMTINEAHVSACPQHAALGNNSGLLSWSPSVTFGGNTVGTVPQATTKTFNGVAKVVPGTLVSDYIPVISVARTDTVGAPYLLRVASHLAANSLCTSYNGTYFPNFNALAQNPGLKHANYSFTAAQASLLSTGNSLGEYGGSVNPVNAIFYYDDIPQSIAFFGDSIIQGQGSSTTYANLANYATMLAYSAGKKLVTANYATSGQTTGATIEILKNVVSKHKPNFAAFKVWSPNDGNTQAKFDAAWCEVMEGVSYCLQNNVIPILITAPPAVGSSWSLIDAQNAKAKAIKNAIVFDFAALMSDSGNNGSILGAYNADGTHINDAGAIVAARALLNLLSVI